MTGEDGSNSAACLLLSRTIGLREAAATRPPHKPDRQLRGEAIKD